MIYIIASYIENAILLLIDKLYIPDMKYISINEYNIICER
jgi:hypothetical protein